MACTVTPRHCMLSPSSRPRQFFFENAVFQNAFPVDGRENEQGAGIVSGPDPPGRVVDVIQMVVGAQENVDSCQVFSGNRRGKKPPGPFGGVIIHTQNRFTHFDQEPHLAQAPQGG